MQAADCVGQKVGELRQGDWGRLRHQLLAQHLTVQVLLVHVRSGLKRLTSLDCSVLGL